MDIGGTFTDLVAFDPRLGRVLQAKCLTTAEDLSQGVWDCLHKAGIGLEDAESIVHGSTIAINIAIEGRGAKTALVVTRGTRDVYKIGRQNRPDAYNFDFRRPVPLTPRSATFEVTERTAASGEILTPLDAAEVESIADVLRKSGAQAVAVCFLHSYANSAHEIGAGEILRHALPGVYVSLSHEIVREYREYERTSTTVMNAYVGPRSSAYIERIENRLADDRFRGRFLIMQSSGGAMSPELAKTKPVAMMESGPVGGVLAAAEIGRRLGIDDVIAFDMGGTTAKTSLIRSSQVSVAQGYHVGGYASGHPVMFPVVDIVEVGAGGGSIAWIDEIGALKVGPQSAGSNPGPIAYGRGGANPTVTDANVVLGRIGAKSFLGGEFVLDAEAARGGVETKLSAALQLDPVRAAHGIVEIAVSKMALAVRGVSVQRGYDPRDFALVAMGGGGPLHALAIARDLHIPRVIVPNLPAHFSALGMLMSDVRQDFVQTYYRRLDTTNPDDLRAHYAELVRAGDAALDLAGVELNARTSEYFMDLRYVGQEFHLQIPFTADELASGDCESARRRFNAVHEQRFSHSAPLEPVELVNLRLTMRGARAKIEFSEIGSGASEPRIGLREIVLEDPARPTLCPIYRRELLGSGTELTGPAAIEEFGSTTILFEGDVARVTNTGEMIVEVGL